VGRKGAPGNADWKWNVLRCFRKVVRDSQKRSLRGNEFVLSVCYVTVQCSDHELRHVSVVLHVYAEKSTFKLSRFSIGRNNVRCSWFTGESNQLNDAGVMDMLLCYFWVFLINVSVHNFFANHTACYWHHIVICPSICPSVMLCFVDKRYILQRNV